MAKHSGSFLPVLEVHSALVSHLPSGFLIPTSQGLCDDQVKPERVGSSHGTLVLAEDGQDSLPLMVCPGHYGVAHSPRATQRVGGYVGSSPMLTILDSSDLDIRVFSFETDILPQREYFNTLQWNFKSYDPLSRKGRGAVSLGEDLNVASLS